MTGIDAAADAFRASMNGTAPAPAKEADDGSAARPTEMFEERRWEGDDSNEEADDTPPARHATQADPEDPEPDGDPDGEPDGEQEEDAEGDQSDEGADPDQPEYEVTVDGAPVTVKLKEALEGYVRTETFHRRMNTLNEAAVELATEARGINENRTKYVNMVTDLEATLKELMPPEPDWEQAFATDPTQAARLQKDYRAFKTRLDDLNEKKTAVLKEQETDMAARTETYAKTELGKFVTLNKINSKEMLDKEVASMRKTGLAAGFSEQEIATVYDSRMLTILRKASKYDRMMAARPKPVNTTKTVAPGSGKRSATDPKGTSRELKRLERTGSMDDATAVFRRFV